MKKIIIIGQMQNKPFLIVIYHSSLEKATMNAACVCKLSNGVKKTPHFLLFITGQRRNKDHCAHFNCGVFEALIGAFTIVNCGMKEKDLIPVRNEYSPNLSKLL
jgi:hypothetical protein